MAMTYTDGEDLPPELRCRRVHIEDAEGVWVPVALLREEDRLAYTRRTTVFLRAESGGGREREMPLEALDELPQVEAAL